MMVLLILAGTFMTVRMRGFQFTRFGYSFRNTLGSLFNKKLHTGKDGNVSPFQAVTTALAGTIGTGSIAGVATAIFSGGPGAIFWMWVIAFFGMATIYAEAVLAQETRVVKEDGSVYGGPVYYIRKAFKGKFGKFLAGFFAIASMLALGFMGSMVQSNAIASNCSEAFGVSPVIIGVIVAVLSGFVFFGNSDRIASVTEKIVPVMALLYIVGSLIILAVKIKNVPESFAMIFNSLIFFVNKESTLTVFCCTLSGKSPPPNKPSKTIIPYIIFNDLLYLTNLNKLISPFFSTYSTSFIIIIF
jgi:AGCS family alanine or glycine:cation symporter